MIDIDDNQLILLMINIMLLTLTKRLSMAENHHFKYSSKNKMFDNNNDNFQTVRNI